MLLDVYRKGRRSSKNGAGVMKAFVPRLINPVQALNQMGAGKHRVVIGAKLTPDKTSVL